MVGTKLSSLSPCLCLNFSTGVFKESLHVIVGFPQVSVGKEPTCNAGDPSSIPGLGRSPGEGIGYPLQYSGLENSMDYTGHGVIKSGMRLSDFRFRFLFV